MSTTLRVPLRIHVKGQDPLDFWCHVYPERLYGYAFFDATTGNIWARKYPVLTGFPLKWYVEHERMGGQLLTPQELDRFLEDRHLLSFTQTEFILNEYANNRNAYTAGRFVNEPSLVLSGS